MLPELLWEKNKISSHLILLVGIPASQIFFKEEKKAHFSQFCNSANYNIKIQDYYCLQSFLQQCTLLGGQSFILQVLFFMIIGKHFTLNLYAVNLPVIWISIWTLYLIKNFFFYCRKDKTPKKGRRRRRDWIELITPKGQTKWILSLDMREFCERFKTWQIGAMMFFD